ncbi:hypothetical protein B0H63DRAFT_301597 [Podospora didyma]|uniref:Uncharacterized protein n=1 Tax=Podospora didyma TaxID=330526 RepID=A0AAE0K9J8_9PEZI|nr:hypothetical protein B0H63DRAFT_301597 [Podospora didyma]
MAGRDNKDAAKRKATSHPTSSHSFAASTGGHGHHVAQRPKLDPGSGSEGGASASPSPSPIPSSSDGSSSDDNPQIHWQGYASRASPVPWWKQPFAIPRGNGTPKDPSVKELDDYISRGHARGRNSPILEQSSGPEIREIRTPTSELDNQVKKLQKALYRNDIFCAENHTDPKYITDRSVLRSRSGGDKKSEDKKNGGGGSGKKNDGSGDKKSNGGSDHKMNDASGSSKKT